MALGEPKPRPKSAQLARGQRRYKRKVASPKQWQAIIAAKSGPCRVCLDPTNNGHDFGRVEFHHIVSRQDGGSDVAENIVPLHQDCHDRVTRRVQWACTALMLTLLDEEYAYMCQVGGESYAERAYGVVYSR